MKGKTTVQVQLEKLFKHCRQNSIGSRHRYFDSCKVFLRFVSEKFKVQNIKNIQDKHLVAFIEHRKEQGISPKTIKNDISAVRYLHDQLPFAGMKAKSANLSTNAELKEKYGVNIDQTPMVLGNRGWAKNEFDNAITIAHQQGKPEYAQVITLCHSMGLRITEAMAISRAQAEAALRSGIYKVGKEAKGGRVREVPLSEAGRKVFVDTLKGTTRGERLFINVAAGEKTHLAVRKAETWLKVNREKFATPEGKDTRYWYNGKVPELTFHGLRYSYVQSRMEELQSQGYSRDAAASIVSQEVGHNRIDVVNVYMGKQ